MITLTKAHVLKYKSIEDSSPVDIAADVTVLVGKNESGKTAFLEALHKAFPLGNAKFDSVFDYPRKDYVRYRPQHDAKSYAKVVELTYSVGDELVARINKEVFDGVQVVPPGQELTRTTTYGNASLIGFSIDQAAAVAALRAGLGGIELADEVFAHASRLEEVVERIDAKKLHADSILAAFAKTWHDRPPKAAGGWGLVDGHIWSAYLSGSLPRFLYFDDYRLLEGKLNLEALQARQATNKLTESDETALGLFELAGISVQELTGEEGYENSKAKLEDLFPEAPYIDAFNSAYEKELKGTPLAASELAPHPRRVEQINQWLKAKGITLTKRGGFNHYRVAQALLPRLTDTSLSPTEFERFEKLFERVNKALT